VHLQASRALRSLETGRSWNRLRPAGNIPFPWHPSAGLGRAAGRCRIGPVAQNTEPEHSESENTGEMREGSIHNMETVSARRVPSKSLEGHPRGDSRRRNSLSLEHRSGIPRIAPSRLPIEHSLGAVERTSNAAGRRRPTAQQVLNANRHRGGLQCPTQGCQASPRRFSV